MTQQGFPILNNLNTVKSEVILCISIISSTTRKRKQSRNPVSVKFPFDVKTIGFQYIVSNWSCHHIEQICLQIFTGWFKCFQIGKAIVNHSDACQFMCNDKSQILVW